MDILSYSLYTLDDTIEEKIGVEKSSGFAGSRMRVVWGDRKDVHSYLTQRAFNHLKIENEKSFLDTGLAQRERADRMFLMRGGNEIVI